MIDQGDLTTCDAEILKACETLRLRGTEEALAERIANYTGRETAIVHDSIYRLREIGMLEDEQIDLY